MRKRKLWRVLAGVIAATYLLAGSGIAIGGVQRQEEPVKLVLNQVNLVGDVNAFVGEHGRTMVPIRLVGEALESEVQYHQKERKVHIRGEKSDISLWVGIKTAKVNGKEVKLDAPPEIVNGRTVVPLRFLGENMGAAVSWQDGTRTVYINAPWVTANSVVVTGSNALLDTDPTGSAKKYVKLERGTSLSILYKDQGRFLVETPEGAIGWIPRNEVALAIGSIPLVGPLAGKVIVLDPGHGNLVQPGNWSNPGAVGPGGTIERDVVMDIALKARDMLVDQGAKVVLTREGDTTLTLAERAFLAEKVGADVFIAIHTNSSPNSALAGTATYYYTSPGVPSRVQRQRLARALQEEVVKHLKRRDIGLIEADFTVLTRIDVPAVLLETAFISNPEEEKLLADPAFRELVARGIVAGLIRYFEEDKPSVATRVELNTREMPR